ncbi:MAG: hypothetical protein ACD_3C00233G0004 [uncultured bacterium (gcode 4)]|uniref:FAD/NAD(P)-binding domain-containing protein n=1 Tax=uncultured bacterium (gcode 4) TaxID=1234023 RepID=K2F7W7_9BACT|nr:MAG: hypothetical protein ACD_3C00233G0004 [uncultured bacterium (gcode 4)]
MYDLAIIWAGSAWLPAWLYASRYKIKNIIIWELIGWALTQSHLVENYPWIKHISWKDLMRDFEEHAKESGSEILNEKVVEISKSDWGFMMKTNSWSEIESKYVLIAVWNKYKHLGLAEEKDFIWRGVSYCATCDWMFFRWRDVAVVGWWNTAFTEALFLAEICTNVHIIHRRKEFRAENALIEQAKKHHNIHFHTNAHVERIGWWLYVEQIKLSTWEDVKVDGVFVAIWNEPDTSIFDSLDIELDDEGYIVVDQRQKTSVDSLYAAWDITTNSNKFKQTLVSAAEWSLAAASIHEDLLKNS